MLQYTALQVCLLYVSFICLIIEEMVFLSSNLFLETSVSLPFSKHTCKERPPARMVNDVVLRVPEVLGPAQTKVVYLSLLMSTHLKNK